MKVEADRLFHDDATPVAFKPSPNRRPGLSNPSVLVIHYTAGRSAEASINWLLNPVAKASAHLVIGRDGSVTQLVSFGDLAFHAGRSLWNGRAQLNQWSLGIELDNPGRLQRTGQVWRTWFGAKVDDDDVIVARHKHGGPEHGWHVYPDAQLQALTEVATALFAGYPSLREVVGHEDIAPGRKLDPGPAFPMASIRSLLIGREDDDEPEADRLFVCTADLNFRAGPSAQAAKLVEVPLPKGSRVELLQRSGAWCQVEVQTAFAGETGQQGWVHGNFLQRA